VATIRDSGRKAAAVGEQAGRPVRGPATHAYAHPGAHARAGGRGRRRASIRVGATRWWSRVPAGHGM